MHAFSFTLQQTLQMYPHGVAEQLKELAQQDTYCGDMRDKFELALLFVSESLRYARARHAFSSLS